MPKLLGPDFISLQVRDLEASTRFYVEHLGLTPGRHSPPGAVVFETAPVPFALRQPLVDLDAVDRLGWGVSLWMACDDADGLHTNLSQAGVPIVVALGDGPFGRFFAFRDPDGYSVTVHTAAAAGSAR
jgi:catechol 2,3-dioxygenase-like lactoylglutathione lyase family enzyme